MSYPFVAEVRIFFGNFAPRRWASCEGQLMPISQNTAVFSLMGTSYGGNGQYTFALPDLRNRRPVGAGWGQGLRDYNLGEEGRNVTMWRADSPVTPDVPEAGSGGPEEGALVPAHSSDAAEQKAQNLTELLRAVDELRGLREQTRKTVNLRAEVGRHVKQAAAQLRDFQRKSREGELMQAGAALQRLILTIGALEILSEKEESETPQSVSRESSYAKHGEQQHGTSTPDYSQTDYDSSSKQTAKTDNPRFLGVNFIVALEGIFPPRS